MTDSQGVRLEKLIGMLDSDFDGERSNAAQMIRHLAKRRGLSLIELFREEFGGNKPKIVPHRRPTHTKREVKVTQDDAPAVPEDERRLLDQLQGLFENDRIDDRDERFVENVLAGFTHDAQLTPPIEARVRKIVRL